jgi:peroxidase
LKYSCPRTGGDNNTNPFDSTTTRFDAQYFRDLLAKKGLLHSDQELFKGDGSGSDSLVKYYGYINPDRFLTDFSASMVKMGNMKPLTGTNGEIRMNCRKVNN